MLQSRKDSVDILASRSVDRKSAYPAFRFASCWAKYNRRSAALTW
jgi:hypothetical protein